VSAEFPATAPDAAPVTPDYGTEDGHVEHGHAHNPLVAHQFDDLAQQKEAGILGMWSFLATEIMFFGGALLAYAIYRSNYHYAFAAASNKELWRVGLFNTFVLLASSYTVVRAVYWAQQGRNEKVFFWIIITILFGLAFIGIKGYEYYHVYAEHLVPGTNFDAPEHGDPERHFNGRWFPPYLDRPAQIFFSFYFTLTGIHALHMVVGVGIMTCVAVQDRQKPWPHYLGLIQSFGYIIEGIWLPHDAQAKQLVGRLAELPVGVRAGIAALAADADPAIADRLRNALATEPDRANRDAIVHALGSIHDPQRHLAALQAVATAATTNGEDLVGLFTSGDHDALVASSDYMRAHIDELLPRMPSTTDDDFPLALALGFPLIATCDAARRDAGTAFTEQHLGKLPGAAIELKQLAEANDHCIAQKQLLEPSLRTWLHKTR